MSVKALKRTLVLESGSPVSAAFPLPVNIGTASLTINITTLSLNLENVKVASTDGTDSGAAMQAINANRELIVYDTASIAANVKLASIKTSSTEISAKASANNTTSTLIDTKLAAIKTASQASQVSLAALDNAVSGAAIKETNSAAIKAAVELIDNAISGNGIVETNSSEINIKLAALNTLSTLMDVKLAAIKTASVNLETTRNGIFQQVQNLTASNFKVEADVVIGDTISVVQANAAALNMTEVNSGVIDVKLAAIKTSSDLIDTKAAAIKTSSELISAEVSAGLGLRARQETASNLKAEVVFPPAGVPVNASASVGTVSTQIVATNSSRRTLKITNDSNKNIFVSFGADAVLGKGHRLGSNGGFLEISGMNPFTGIVKGIFSGTTSVKNVATLEY